MSTGKPPEKPPAAGAKPVKPFLGDDDLSELDAWDSTFDALHTGPEGGAPAGDEVMAWPSAAPPSAPVKLSAPAPALVDYAPAAEIPEIHDDLDDQMTLDGALAEDPVAETEAETESTSERRWDARPSQSETIDADPMETDFSDLGTDGARPEALGALLGRHTTAPPEEMFDEDATRVQMPLLTADDEEVFTSASRPSVPASPRSDDADIGETAPPPPPVPAPEPRRPAIIRRSTPTTPAPLSGAPSTPLNTTPAGGYTAYSPSTDFGAESTRIHSYGDLEAQRYSSDTSPPPIAEDDYADIEMVAEDASAKAVPARTADVQSSPVRRTAHVLRRGDAPTRPPPIANPAALAPVAGESTVIEITTDEDALDALGDDGPFGTGAGAAIGSRAPTPSPGDEEDDFSDVALAVGAVEDVPLPSDPIVRAPSRAMPALAGDSGRVEVQDIDPTPLPPPQRPDLDDALDALGGLGDESAHDAPTVDAKDDETIERTLPPLAALPRAPVVAPVRPPALVDLYPRVKTPTSVPPLGMNPGALLGTGVDRTAGPSRTLMGVTPPPEAATFEPDSRPIDDTKLGIIAAPPAAHAPEYIADAVVSIEPELDLDGIQLPEQTSPLTTAALDEASAAALVIYEREIATVDEAGLSATLRIEAGRLSERLGEVDAARAHYDAALLADPRATTALRGLRRLARGTGDLVEATRHLDAEIAVAGALERRPLGHYRIDLLMASGDQDLARVAVGDLLDAAPSDVRALLAQLELAFLDGRADEFGTALEQLAHAVTDVELRAAVQSARATLAAHQNDSAAAQHWFAAAAESDPAAMGARLGAVRHAAAQADGPAAARALVDLGHQVETSDPRTAAALGLRAQQWVATGELAAAAATLATATAPDDPLVARLAAEAAGAGDDPATAGAAFARWASTPASPAERAYAAARAAELIPGRGTELWAQALALDNGDDYGAAQLRTAHVSADATDQAIEVDLAIAADVTRDRARLRAAFGLIAQNKLDAAILLLAASREARPHSLAIAEALGEALAAAGAWSERAQLFSELADEPGEQLDKEVAELRSALAWEEAVGAAAEPAPPGAAPREPDAVSKATASALGAWDRVLERAASGSSAAPAAHAAAIVLAARLGDRDVLGEILARAQAAERSPWAAASIALRRARLVGADDPARAESILREAPLAIDDPRRTAALVMAAARRKEPAEVAAALEERAGMLGEKGNATEVAALRLRAAQLALDAGDAARATTLLGQVERALPGLGVVPDLLAAARRRAGDRPSVATSAPTATPVGAAAGDAFARLLRDGDLALAHGDGHAALALYQRALELRPGDPLAAVPLVRAATSLREPAPITALALAQLRAAEGAGDNAAKADAYELLALIDHELRSDVASAQIALESAAQADPTRIDLMHRLERHYAAQGDDKLGELLRLRRAELDALATLNTAAGGGTATYALDRAAITVDLAALATRDRRPDAEIAELYRAALAADPRHRLALLHLESMTRRAGASAELADIEERIAGYFEGDPRSQAAFWTRAGETLAELGQIDAAVQRFTKADAASPGSEFALEGWRHAALKGQLWVDVAEAATRQASSPRTTDAERATLHHLAGVAMMDKALAGEQAMASFRRALAAEPKHKDAFLRLRILLEEDANHDDLATLLAQRLAVEEVPRAQVELHRALAELHRNFLSDRDTAKEHYRAILAFDPNDLRAYSAIADIAWEQGAWQDAADALVARARLEREPEILKTLCYRLGLIYADRLIDVPMALMAFQRALSFAPDDENTLIRLADLATQAGEWKLALGACERLVKAEGDPDRRAMHLHRVARIFREGFGDTKRAERALNLALDIAPTNDDALTALVQFYRDAGDLQSVRVHLNRVAGTMRARFDKDAKDGIACRVISRAMFARGAAGVGGSLAIARAAAELAELLGAGGEPETRLLAEAPHGKPENLLRPEADEVLFPRGVPPSLRQMFQILGDKVGKHVGTGIQPYGVTRGDRLRARDSEVAAAAQDVATALGFGEIDIFVSAKQPYAMVAEPTSPVSLVIGQAIAQGTFGGSGPGKPGVRFAAGAALKLAQSSLAIPARMAPDDLGVLVIALLRLYQPEFPTLSVDGEAVATQMQKLRRLIPTGTFNELRPFALAVDPAQLGHRELAAGLRVAALRAGLVASGSLLAGLGIVAAQAGTDLAATVTDPVAAGLIQFAIGEDHAVVTG